jgi:hypothetical protein
MAAIGPPVIRPGKDYFLKMVRMSTIDIAAVAVTLERAWAAALPGHEVAERNCVMHELHHLLQSEDIQIRSPALRLVASTPPRQ